MQQYFRNYLVLSFITYLGGRELQEVHKPPEILYKMVQAFMYLCVFTRFSKGVSDSPLQKHVQKWIHLPTVSRLISSIAEAIIHVFWFSTQWVRSLFHHQFCISLLSHTAQVKLTQLFTSLQENDVKTAWNT